MFAKITPVTPMFPKSLAFAGNPKRMLIAGWIGAVLVVSINTVAEYGNYRAVAAENREYTRRTLAYERCAADVKKSGKFGDLLDIGIQALCPRRPSREAIDSLANEVRISRTNALQLAGILFALGSMPWLASRWRSARVVG